jgi:hypothetical protein
MVYVYAMHGEREVKMDNEVIGALMKFSSVDGFCESRRRSDIVQLIRARY